MKRSLIIGLPVVAITLGILYALGITPAVIFEHVSGKAFAMLEKKADTPDQETSTNSDQAKNLANAPSVSVARVDEADFTEKVLVTGSLVARDQVMIAPEIDGLRVLSYEAEEGDWIKKGQLLVTLESTTLKSSRDQNTAAIARADASIAQSDSQILETQAVLKEAEAALKRARPLRKSRHISGATFDQRESAAKSAKARVQSAKSGQRLAQAEKQQLIAQRNEIVWRLSRSEVRSPVDGLISRRNVRVGDLSSSSSRPMFEVVQNGQIELDAEIDERNLAKIKQDQTADIQVTGVGYVSGTVRLVSPQVDVSTRLGRVRIFLGSNRSLKIGAFARGTIKTAHTNGLAIPATAVLYQDGQASVLKVMKNQVRLIAVKIGLQTQGRAQILKGLNRGDIVVAKAGTFLRDGDHIRAVGSPTHSAGNAP